MSFAISSGEDAFIWRDGLILPLHVCVSFLPFWSRWRNRRRDGSVPAGHLWEKEARGEDSEDEGRIEDHSVSKQRISWLVS